MNKPGKEYYTNLASILESTEDAIISKALDGTIQSWNKGSEQMFGYTSKEMIGKNISLIIPPEFINEDNNHLHRIPNMEIVDRYETIRIKKNGEQLYVSLIVSDLKDRAGNITGFYQVARDITSKKKSEAELIEAYRELAFQNQEKDKRAGELFTANIELAFQNAEKEKRANELLIANEELAFQNEEKLKRAEELLIANKELAFQNAEKEKRANEMLIANEELAFQNEEKQKRAEELLMANKELDFLNKNQQALFASIVNSSDDAMLSKTLDGTITSWNYGAEKIFGYSADEIIGKNVLTLIPPNLQQEEIDIAKKIQSGETVDHYETRRIRKDDSTFHASLTISPIRNFEGNIIGASKVLMDITKQKEAEQKLSASLKKLEDYKFALDQSSIVALADQKGVIKYVNDNFLAITKYSREELIGQDFMKIDSGHQSSSFIKNLRVTIANGRIWKGELNNKAKDGSTYWVDTTIVPFLDNEGKPYQYMAIRTDITERKKSEEDKKQLTKRLQLATKSAKMGIWHWNLKTNKLEGDKGMYELYGIVGADFEAVYDGWISRIHNEDSERVAIEVQLAITNKKDYDTEFRVVWEDTSIHYVRATGIVERDNNGKAIRMIGANWDVTKEKEKEQHLTLLESVITYTTDAVLITEAEPFDEPGHKIVFINEAFTKMTGYSSEDVIGKTPKILQGPKSDKVALKRFGEAIRKWEPCEISTINYKKNGEEYWVNFSVSPVANERGLYTHFISIERDVTEIKLAEIQLNELNKDLQQKAKELAASNDELEQFAYVASHDLQEPLRMVTSFLSKLELKYGSNIDETGKKYIGFAVDGAKRMRKMILDLLEYSRAGKTTEHKEQLDLNELLTEIKILLRQKIEEKTAVFEIDNLPIIMGHRSPMRQTFQNLVSNALKYSDDDIPVRICITVKELEDSFQFAVADNGIGINKEYFNKIFVIFQRLHNKNEYSGTGLGLAIVKKIIEIQGGKIWVESEEGKGSTFYFTIKR